MQLKSYLFCLSLMAFMGCTEEKDAAAMCDMRLDSIGQQHAHVIDSLGGVIAGQIVWIHELENRNQAIRDSVKQLSETKNGPDIPPPIAKGDPIRDGD